MRSPCTREVHDHTMSPKNSRSKKDASKKKGASKPSPFQNLMARFGKGSKSSEDTEAPKSPQELQREEILAAYENDPDAYKKFQRLDDKDSSGGRKRVLWRNRIILIVLALVILVMIARCSNVSEPDLDGLAKTQDTTAEAFATSYVTDWFTWTEEDPQERGTRLSQYNPSFGYNEGWNGSGQQTVTEASPVEVEQPEGDKYVVTVRYNVEGDPVPQYAEVALYSQDGEVSPLSTPSLVTPPNLPAANRPEDERPTSNDREQNALLEDRLEVFFTAWGKGDSSTIDAVTTPGANQDALGAPLEATRVTAEEVYMPSEDNEEERTVRVTVTWESESGAASDSVYEVDMLNVSDSWLVDSVNAGADNPAAYVGDQNNRPGNEGSPSEESASASPSPSSDPSASTSSASPSDEASESGDDEPSQGSTESPSGSSPTAQDQAPNQ